MPAWCTTSSRGDTDPNKLRTFLNAGQGQTPPVSDFVHRPTVFKSIHSYTSPNVSGCAPGETVRKCISTYGDEFQFDRQTAKGTCIISRPCGDGAVCSKVADVNKSGLDYNRVNCKRSEYLVVQERDDEGWKLVATCSDGHERMPLMMAMTAVTPIMTAHATPQSR
jgi:hypothetical protein